MGVEFRLPIERLFRDCVERPIHLNLCRYRLRRKVDGSAPNLPASIDKNNNIRLNDQAVLRSSGSLTSDFHWIDPDHA